MRTIYPETLLRQILTCLDPYDETEMARRMAGQFQALHLLDSEGSWATPLLENRSKQLLPGTVTMTALRNTGAFRRAPFFYRIKLRTVASSVSFVIQTHRQPHEKLKHNYGSRWLRLNILEAVFSDLLMGFFDNAKAGLVLAVQKAGQKRPDPFTGAAPCCWSADGKTVCLGQPFVKSWDDLYQIWNMAFLSTMDDLPFIISKLLIPEVSGYADHPGSFMHKRLIALYLYMAWLFFDRSYRLNHHLPLMNWYNPVLTRFWGACARQVATEYSIMFRPRPSATDRRWTRKK